HRVVRISRHAAGQGKGEAVGGVGERELEIAVPRGNLLLRSRTRVGAPIAASRLLYGVRGGGYVDEVGPHHTWRAAGGGRRRKRGVRRDREIAGGVAGLHPEVIEGRRRKRSEERRVGKESGRSG